MQYILYAIYNNMYRLHAQTTGQLDREAVSSLGETRSRDI